MALNIADLFEHAVDVVPERFAIQCGDHKATYSGIEADANRLAHFLQSRGIGRGDHVGVYARNSIEHVVALLAVFKVRAVPINVNYRYVEGELDYLFDNADIVALLHERRYAPQVAACAPRHDRLHTIVSMPDPTEPGPDDELARLVTSYDGVAWADALDGQSDSRDFGERSDDDIYIVYTGGTTGYPKGVMWRHVDFWRVLGGGIDFMTGESLEEFDQSKQAATNEAMVTF
ncbi:MAG TPA: AMP-binding protein, partial [Nocardioides sp.]|nr:AMP-binding protein [Nocardioides sp.]